MTNDIPEIDDLLKGINDPDMVLSDENKTEIEEQPVTNKTTNEENSSKDTASEVEHSDSWFDFLSYLESSDTDDKGERMICKLDRDLADTLDDCNIHNRSRSDMVNAIVRTFFKTHLPQLAQYRRDNKSLFANYKEEEE